MNSWIFSVREISEECVPAEMEFRVPGNVNFQGHPISKNRVLIENVQCAARENGLFGT